MSWTYWRMFCLMNNGIIPSMNLLGICVSPC